MLLSLFTVTAKKFLDRSVSQVINKLKYGNKIITIGVALPVAFCLHQSFLDINMQENEFAKAGPACFT